jgi:hypothetical protein
MSLAVCAEGGRSNRTEALNPLIADALAVTVALSTQQTENILFRPSSARGRSHRRPPSGDPEPLKPRGLPYQISLTIAVDVEPSYMP